MSVIHSSSILSSYTEKDLYSLDIHPQSDQVIIDMTIFSCPLHTSRIPQIVDMLQAAHPSVLQTECFNEENLTFTEEVQNTEIGHLFEHIMLAYLMDLQGERGDFTSVYNGVTKWNWVEEQEGTFHITIDAGYKDSELISKALEKSISLLTSILKYKSPSIAN